MSLPKVWYCRAKGRVVDLSGGVPCLTWPLLYTKTGHKKCGPIRDRRDKSFVYDNPRWKR